MENDVFKRNKTPLTEAQLLKIDLIKCEGEKLLTAITLSKEELEKDSIPDLRCLSIARTKLEEAVMWAVKGYANFHQKGVEK